MKILMIGAGNIGLITALCLAENGHEVFCIDSNHSKISKLSLGQSTLYETGLDELLNKQLLAGKIHFSAKLEDSINQTDLIFLAVGTPNYPDGRVNLSHIESAVAQIASLSQTTKTVIIRSTVPPRTNLKLSEMYPSLCFVSSPEFLREGSAIYDCLNPDRIILGSNKPEHLELFKKIYANFKIDKNKIIQMDSTSAELTKYASNIFLASRISLINEFSRICEKTGANIEMIKEGMSLDSRIGTQFLNSGLGYGGSCFPKDIDALITFASDLNENLQLTKSIKATNDTQISAFAKKILNILASEKKHICIWGASFKPNTDDLREAPSLKIIDILISNGLKINIYDPKAGPALEKIYLGNRDVCIMKSALEAAQNTEALIISTEWAEFKNYDLIQLKSLLKNPLVFDGRNIFNPKKMKEFGFEYYSIGRPS